MVTCLKRNFINASTDYVELFCLSTDTKPTTGVANGSVCEELDADNNTLTVYRFNGAGAEWIAVSSTSYSDGV